VQDFAFFLQRFQEACSRFDHGAVMACVAEDYVGVYRYPGGMQRVYDREALAEGWQAASEYFVPAGACLVYRNLALMEREEERLVASLVDMPAPGGPPGHSFLLATFAPRGGEWRLVREDMEHRVVPTPGNGG
jgi:ketosteroid isomerase-like protein